VFDCEYEGKRSKNLLKVKKFHDAEYKVIDCEEGTVRYIKDGKEIEEVMLSNIIIEHKGNNVGVGSGFTIDQRKEFYKDPSKIMFKIVTVQYFEESQNKAGEYSLRFPVLKIIHGDERTV
jgi:DNA ligase-1